MAVRREHHIHQQLQVAQRDIPKEHKYHSIAYKEIVYKELQLYKEIPYK